MYYFTLCCTVNILGQYSDTISVIMSLLYPSLDFVFGFASFLLVDNWGRRPLLNLDYWGICGCLLVIFVCLYFSYTKIVAFGYVALVAMVFHVICRSVGGAKISLLLETELFPTQMRSVASSMRAVGMDTFNLLVMFTYATLYEAIGPFVYLVLLGPMICASLYISCACPETANREVADIVESFQNEKTNKQCYDSDRNQGNI